MKREILGFDFRLTLPERWPVQRRKQYLLAPSVPVPWSIDETVWTSMFSFDAISTEVPQRLMVEAKDFHQQGLHLWADLAQMQEAIKSSSLPVKGRCVCFTIEGDSVREERWQMAFDEPTAPSVLDPQWKFEGYDVADVFFTSGLSNCGYQEGRIERARDRWGHLLNANGLFTAVQEAQQFKQYSDARVPTHAPFYVFGVYQVIGKP